MRNSNLALVRGKSKLKVLPSSGEPSSVEPPAGSARGLGGPGPSPDPFVPLLDWLDEIVFGLDDTATRLKRLADRLRADA